MTLDSTDPDHAELVGLLQPFVDGELSDDERVLVAAQIARNPEYQAVVRDQQEVRAALRGLERERVPAGLRERVLAELDGVDDERRAAQQRGWFAPIAGRITAFGRGALLMVPAAAAAFVLFVVASNQGWVDGPSVKGVNGVHVDGGMSDSLGVQPKLGFRPAAQPTSPPPAGPLADASLPPLDELDPGDLGFAVQVAPQRSLPQGVALVSDDPGSAGSSASVRYRDGGPGVLVDHQRRAGVAELQGTRQVFRDHAYYLGIDEQGRPRVECQIGRVHHNLVLEGGGSQADPALTVDSPEFGRLLNLADALRRAHGG
jgi:hypothetical protein